MKPSFLRTLHRFLSHPAVQGAGPFLLLIALWAVVAELGIYPRAFFPSPGEVLSAFSALMYKGILPAYVQDSVTRLAVGAAAGIVVGIPLGFLMGLSPTTYRLFWPLVLRVASHTAHLVRIYHHHRDLCPGVHDHLSVDL